MAPGLALLIATPVAARDDAGPDVAPHRPLRELCSERPGLTTAACTVDPGHIQIETGLVAWTLDRRTDSREDRIEGADMLLRTGMGPTTEFQMGWMAYGRVRTLDRMQGTIDVARGTGDLTLGLKQNLRHPAEGKRGFAAAILPHLSLPIGDSDVGDGDWSAGLIMPLSYKVNDGLSFALSPEIEAAADEDGSGRHLAYGAALGFQLHVAETMRLSPDIQLVRDRDPQRAATLTTASLSFDMQVKKWTQFDVQAVAGLNRDTPDLRLSCGVTHKF